MTMCLGLVAWDWITYHGACPWRRLLLSGSAPYFWDKVSESEAAGQPTRGCACFCLSEILCVLGSSTGACAGVVSALLTELYSQALIYDLCLSFETSSLCNPAYPGTHFVDQAGLCLLEAGTKGHTWPHWAHLYLLIKNYWRKDF